MGVEVTVGHAGPALRVAFTGTDRLWVLKGGLEVPLDRVREARVLTRAQARKECPPLRLPGSYWPGRLHAGSYGLGKRRQLWCVHRGAEVLAVDLAVDMVGPPPYARVVLEVPDPRVIADRINAARILT